jgi:hypothetical protein
VRRALVRTIAAVALIIAPLAALSQPRRAAAIPTLKGTLLIQWDGESRFIYLPDPNNPLTFLTRDGRTIVPARMYTDGGSVPRVFWGAKGFSPWGYGPAYILHDWLFHRHRCGEDTGPDRYSMAQANQVLDDAIEYLMRTGKVSRNNQARHLITWAVNKFASTAWNEACGELPPAPLAFPGGPPIVQGVTVGRITFE